MPKGFFPQQDNGTVFGGMRGPQDASFGAMQAAAAQIANLIKDDPAVANTTAFTGGNGPGNSGFVYLALKPLKERKIGASEVIRRLAAKTGACAQAFRCSCKRDRTCASADGKATRNINTRFKAKTWRSGEVGANLLQEMRKLPGLTDVNSDQQNNGLQVSLVYDRATAARSAFHRK